jgi:Protein of unknown function (DUF3048) N-terminal domain/Protein of unknown function (DUF3048) C-terminal domain
VTTPVRWLAAVVVLSVALAGCGDEPVETEPPAAEPTPELTPEPIADPTPEPVWPLTGLPAPEGVDGTPVLVVKVDNTGPAAPQVGLSSADLVVQELVEGGLTRLAVMYHSSWPGEVAPVRSVRTSDIGLVLPTGGALVASGGAGRVLRQMDDAGLTVLVEGAAGFSRMAGRSAPYNVAVDLERLRAEATDLDPPGQPYLPWADPDDERPAGTPVAGLEVAFSSAHVTSWEWDGKVWQRSRELAADGDAFEPDTVLVLRVAIRDAGYTDPAGNVVPETVLEGSGDALLFTDGRLTEGRWSKDGPADPFELTDDDGDALLVPPGRTWIELVPDEGGDVTLTTPASG